MKTAEFRIGNLIHWNIPEKIGVTHEIVVIKENRINTIPISLGESMDDYLPIPLTKEWLLKFGFKRIKKGIGWDEFSDGKLSLVEVPTNRGNIVAFNYAPDKYNYLKYVHQLQNLYFALTGVELQLSST